MPNVLRLCFVVLSFLASVTAAQSENLEFRVEAMMPYGAFDKLEHHKIDVPQGQLSVGFAPGTLRIDKQHFLNWVGRSASAISVFYGRFPVNAARVLLVPNDGDKISGGQAFGNAGAAVRVMVGSDVTADALKEDWQLPHEMVHLAFPALPDATWLSEGLAVYVESIARAQAGDLSNEHIWNEFVRMMPAGLPKKGDKGLDNAKDRDRVYWGGATFWLMADLEIRKRTQNRTGLQDALLAVQDAGGNYEKIWSIERTLDVADRATGHTVLKEFYAQWRSKPVAPDLDSVWRDLGVKIDGKTVRFEDNAKSAAVRKAITTQRFSRTGASLRPAQDGRIIQSASCEEKQWSYDAWLKGQEEGYAAEIKSAAMHGIALKPFSELRAKLPDADEFARRRSHTGFVCEKLAYQSDGLKVIGFLWRPKNSNERRMPLIIFNRGGGQELSKLVPWERDGFYDFLTAGYVVIGSQYRGNDGGEGHDDEGGAEVNDILNLIPLARSLGYIDMDNIFMVGESRGAMMTYLAMRNGAKIRAAAVVGSETDLAENLNRRPELRKGYIDNVTGFSDKPGEALSDRSAIFWPQAISAPLLLMHGGDDWRVPPSQSLTFAAKLGSLRKPYELAVFQGDVHLLSFNWRDRDRRTIQWFDRHKSTQP